MCQTLTVWSALSFLELLMACLLPQERWGCFFPMNGFIFCAWKMGWVASRIWRASGMSTAPKTHRSSIHQWKTLGLQLSDVCVAPSRLALQHIFCELRIPEGCLSHWVFMEMEGNFSEMIASMPSASDPFWAAGMLPPPSCCLLPCPRAASAKTKMMIQKTPCIIFGRCWFGAWRQPSTTSSQRWTTWARIGPLAPGGPRWQDILLAQLV